MNIPQRVTLVLGAIAAVMVFLTGAPWERIKSAIYANPSAVVAFQVTLLGRLALVLAVTGLVWFALRGARFDTIDWSRFRRRTRRVYLVLWIGWLGFGLLWIPLQSEYERRDILSQRDQIMNRYPELRGLTHEMMRDFIYTSWNEQRKMLGDPGLEPEVRLGFERILRLRDEERSLVGHYIPNGFAGMYREHWVGILSVIVLIPAGLYVLPRVILAAARWSGWSLKGD